MSIDLEKKITSVNFRLRLEEYKPKDIENIFKDKYNCKECPFRMTWKGNLPEFALSDFHRYYCKIKYARPILTDRGDKSEIALITGLSNYDAFKESLKIREAWAEVIKSNDYKGKVHWNKTNISVLVPHFGAKDKRLFAVSVLYLKEQDLCPIDEANRGVRNLDPKNEATLIAYRKRHGIL